MTTPTIININELDLELIHPSSQLDVERGGHKIVVVGKPGCFIAGTKVLMYDGHIMNVEDIRVGDKIMGDDSTPRTVLQLCRNRDMMYKIMPKYGESYTVNKEHKLVLTDISNNNHIIEIPVSEYITKPIYWKKRWRVFKNGVTAFGGETEYCLKDIAKEGKDLLDTQADSIPHTYKVSTWVSRKALLEGMIQSTCSEYNSHHNHHILRNITSEYMADDVLFLARSLSIPSYKHRIYSSDMKQSYNIILYCQAIDMVTQFSHLSSAVQNYTMSSSLFRVQEAGEDYYYGFTLNGNHRFLLASFDVVRNTGKTTLISAILYAKKHIIPVGMVMSGSEDSNGFFGRIFPSTFVYNEYNEDKIYEFIKRQKLAKSQNIANPWAVLIIDDCTDSPAIFKKPLQQGLYKKGRHHALLYILSLQYCMDVPPAVRTNVDGIFILREPILKNRKSLYENYAGIIPDFGIFCDIMDQLTDDYTALYIHNDIRANDWTKCVFWFNATKPPDGFKFGCADYWAFHNERFDPAYRDPIG